MRKLKLLMVTLALIVGGNLVWADTDYTSKVNNTKEGWTGASGTYGNAKAPNQTTLNIAERYWGGESVSGAGVSVFSQTVTGLDNGTYTVVFYATANNARCPEANGGILSDASDLVYVYAGSDKSHKTYVTSHKADAYTYPGEYIVSNVSVTDGTLELGMFAEKTGTQWQTIQVKALIRTDEATLENGVDMTKAIINPTVYNAGETAREVPYGWTFFERTAGNDNRTSGTGDTQLELWSGSEMKVDVYQSLANLPNGAYKVTAYCHDQNGTNKYSVYGYNPENSKRATGTINVSGDDHYADITSDKIVLTDGRINIGLKGESSGSWVTADNFRLTYYGASIQTVATTLPTGGAMEANQWYVYDIIKGGDYELSTTSGVVYTQDGTQNFESAITTAAASTITLTEGKLYLKATSNVAAMKIYTWLYLSTTVNAETKWLNTNSSDENKAYVSDYGLPFMLEKDADDNYYLKFSEGNYLRDRGDNWVVLTTGSANNTWKLQPEDGGYKLLLPTNNSCELVVANTSTGLVDMTHNVAGGGNIWQFVTPAEALAQAKAKANTRTLGFENGEYAPYNNVAAISAISEAEAATTNSARMTAYASLASATWTANDGEVNAFAYGDFSTYETISSKNYPYGWNLYNGDNNHSRIMGGSEGTENTGLSASSSGKALLLKYNATYGETDGYTMPLKAGKIYKITFKYGGWGNNPNTTVSMNDPNGAAITLAPNFVPLTNDAYSNAEHWYNYTGYFAATTTGNYTLNLNKVESGQQQIIIADIDLRTAEDITFADGSVPTYAPGTYPTVKISRSLTEGRWATAVYPFAVSGVDNIAVLSSFDAGTGSIRFESATESVANKPFLMRSSSDKSVITLNNIAVSATTETPTVTKNEASLIGAYNSTEITKDKDNYVLFNNGIYDVGDAGATINPYRAYIQIAGGSGARSLVFLVDDEETTAIEGLNSERTTTVGNIYNLNGQLVRKNADNLNGLRKGIYIVGGKRITVK
jgi:hypothetical protein